MTRVIVVADRGAMLASLTAAVGTVRGATVVRHGSSASRLDALVMRLAPDLVVIGDLTVPEHALARLAEIAVAAPDAQTVVLSSAPEAGRLADALRANATAVLPGDVEPETLGPRLQAVLAARGASVHVLPERPADVPMVAGAAA